MGRPEGNFLEGDIFLRLDANSYQMEKETNAQEDSAPDHSTAPGKEEAGNKKNHSD